MFRSGEDLIFVLVASFILLALSIILKIYVSYWKQRELERYLRHLVRERKRKEDLLYEKNKTAASLPRVLETEAVFSRRTQGESAS